VKWAAPEKSPDLGNSSPAPKALMYIELATDICSGQARKYKLDRSIPSIGALSRRERQPHGLYEDSGQKYRYYSGRVH
jgi:hypothetical protein